MCLGIPMQIIELQEFSALCEAKGVRREISLIMMLDEPLAVGDYLVIQGGYATEKVSAERAQEAWDVYDQMTPI